jgi:hypothetical protein
MGPHDNLQPTPPKPGSGLPTINVVPQPVAQNLQQPWFEHIGTRRQIRCNEGRCIRPRFRHAGKGSTVMADHVQIVLVGIPSAGSNEPIRHVKPGQYPHQCREAWRPATRPPSKAHASASLLRQIVENEAAVRSMLKPQPLTR